MWSKESEICAIELRYGKYEKKKRLSRPRDPRTSVVQKYNHTYETPTIQKTHHITKQRNKMKRKRNLYIWWKYKNSEQCCFFIRCYSYRRKNIERTNNTYTDVKEIIGNCTERRIKNGWEKMKTVKRKKTVRLFFTEIGKKNIYDYWTAQWSNIKGVFVFMLQSVGGHIIRRRFNFFVFPLAPGSISLWCPPVFFGFFSSFYFNPHFLFMMHTFYIQLVFHNTRIHERTRITN